MWQEADFSGIYHRISKDRNRGHPPISPDPKEWPKEWKTVQYKTYPRLPKIDLLDSRIDASLSSLLSKRTTRREYTGEPVSLMEVSSLLQCSCGMINGRSRAQPSAGARYPIEAYVAILQQGGDLPVGLYHYDVLHHRLDVLSDKNIKSADITKFFTFDWTVKASAVIILTSVFERSRMKYGDRGYRYALLEAGHIGQGIHLSIEAIGLGCCALGGADDIALERWLDIDGISESIMYVIAIGRPVVKGT